MINKTKICSKCNTEKSLDEFSPHSKNRTDGKQSQCKNCRMIYERKRRKENPDKIKEINKKSSTKHRESRRNYSTQWNNNHKEYFRKWKETHRINARMSVTRWRINHPKENLIDKSNRRARERGGGGKLSVDDWNDILKQYDNRCLCCGRRDVSLTIDHIIPLSKNGKSVKENIQPLCKSCNSRKRDKIIDYRPIGEQK